jgi:hypothetical protein
MFARACRITRPDSQTKRQLRSWRSRDSEFRKNNRVQVHAFLHPAIHAASNTAAVPCRTVFIGTVPYGTTGTGAPAFASSFCGTNSSGPHGGMWYPDLRRDEQYIDIDLMVKF